MRRILSILLAVLLATLAPICALAEESSLTELINAIKGGKELEASVTFTAADGGKSQSAILDLFTSMSAKLNIASDALALRLSVSNEEALSGKVHLRDGGDLYVKCDAIGDFALCFPRGDTLKLAMGAVTALAKDGKPDLVKLSGMPARELLGKITDNDADVLKWYDELIKTAVVSEGTFTASEHDDAVRQTVVVIDANSVCTLLDTGFAKRILNLSGDSQGSQSAQANLDKIKKRFVDDKFMLSVRVLSNAEGQPVSLAANGGYTDSRSKNNLSYILAGTIHRKTDAGGVKLTLSGTRADAAKPDMINREIALALSGGNERLDIAASVAGSTKRFTAEGYLNGERGSFEGSLDLGVYLKRNLAKPDYLISLDAMGNVTGETMSAVVALSLNNAALCKMNMSGELRERTNTFDDMRSLTPDNAKKPLSMGQQELSKLRTTINSNITMFGFKVLSLLPSSVWTLLIDALTQMTDII